MARGWWLLGVLGMWVERVMAFFWWKTAVMRHMSVVWPCLLTYLLVYLCVCVCVCVCVCACVCMCCVWVCCRMHRGRVRLLANACVMVRHAAPGCMEECWTAPPSVVPRPRFLGHTMDIWRVTSCLLTYLLLYVLYAVNTDGKCQVNNKLCPNDCVVSPSKQ